LALYGLEAVFDTGLAFKLHEHSETVVLGLSALDARAAIRGAEPD